MFEAEDGRPCRWKAKYLKPFGGDTLTDKDEQPSTSNTLTGQSS